MGGASDSGSLRFGAAGEEEDEKEEEEEEIGKVMP
jgi:hypothetical protein